MNKTTKHVLVSLLFVLLAALRPDSGLVRPPSTHAAGTTIYVDGQIGTNTCSNYQPGTRSCGGGSDTAYNTLAGAATVTQPGDMVWIRQGTYSEQFEPPNSGTAGNPITYRNHAGEVINLASGSYPATIVLENVSYITIQGITVADHRWVEATDAHHIILRENQFLRTPSSGTTGNVRFISSDHNQIVDNLLDDGNDNLLLIDSDHNLVENNTITEGRHSVFSIRCSNFNIVRDNYFANSQQKIGEVYDCGDDTTAVPHAFNATKYNLFENNVFAEAVTYYSTSGGNGIQYAGQEGIIRHNVFYHNNVGIGMQVYGDEALYNHHNRVYHNVFYENYCAGLSVRGNSLDNLYQNNILYQNQGTGGGDCFGLGPAQVLYRNSVQEYLFERNNILNQGPGEAVIQQEFGSGNTLDYFEANYPGWFFDNLEVIPYFRDEGNNDFRLTSSSPMIDAGTFLAQAIGNGSGTNLTVNDARYFHDGYDIAGVSGDLVQLQGQTETATVLDIDYGSNTLTLDRPLTWTAGQGVSLAYQGSAPDIGAFELFPELELHGRPADQAIQLNWTVNTSLPMTTTWQIDYYTQTITAPFSATNSLSTTRSYTLNGLENYQWYTVTLHAMLDNSSWLSDTIRAMPTDIFVHLPLVLLDRSH